MRKLRGSRKGSRDSSPVGEGETLAPRRVPLRGVRALTLLEGWQGVDERATGELRVPGYQTGCDGGVCFLGLRKSTSLFWSYRG